ncbi:MAG: HDOD domain-containing protein [Acidobacteria bacterium]|nr:HDOD domain-containing protein [Acidobacteriota bacterium]MBI3426991.1 HDOD domain-containing protein [Acidobacteriota bacterium]
MIQGETHTLPLGDLIQWIALTRRTGGLTMRQGADNPLQLYFVRGEIAAASVAETFLASAEKITAVLCEALNWRSGHYAFCGGPLPPQALFINLQISPERLLVAACAQQQQQQQQQQPAKTPPAQTDDWAETEDYTETFGLADALRLALVDRLLREDFCVPVMPQLAVRVLELTRKKDYSLRELGTLIYTDQAVAARLLRSANSFSFGGEVQVSSLTHAIQRLGETAVVNLVLAASLQRQRLGQDIFAPEQRALSIHSAAAAFVGQTLAGCIGLNAGHGFLCGLLMDFGKTIIYALIQQVRRSQLNPGPLPRPIIESLVRDYHPRVGRVVGEQWKLPVAVIETMAHHHCFLEAAAERPYVALAALADGLTTFALKQPPASRAQVLANLTPARLLTHPAALFLKLNEQGASIVLRDLPYNLERAQNFVND